VIRRSRGDGPWEMMEGCGCLAAIAFTIFAYLAAGWWGTGLGMIGIVVVVLIVGVIVSQK
jgi:hypothetical protein